MGSALALLFAWTFMACMAQRPQYNWHACHAIAVTEVFKIEAIVDQEGSGKKLRYLVKWWVWSLNEQ
jgi:hypothetical protein